METNLTQTSSNRTTTITTRHSLARRSRQQLNNRKRPHQVIIVPRNRKPSTVRVRLVLRSIPIGGISFLSRLKGCLNQGPHPTPRVLVPSNFPNPTQQTTSIRRNLRTTTTTTLRKLRNHNMRHFLIRDLPSFVTTTSCYNG